MNFLGGPRFIIPLLLVAFASSHLACAVSAEPSIDAKTLFRANKESVVLIMSFDKNNQPLAIGSGFFVDDGRIVITNYHVVEGAAVIKIKMCSGPVVSIVNAVGVDVRHDLVALEVPLQGKPLLLAKRKPEVGEDIIVIGNPKGLEGTLSTGIISGLRDEDGSTYYQITAPISPGSSGGPIIDANGEVLGVSTFQITGGQNLNFAMPFSYVLGMISSQKKRPVGLITGTKHQTTRKSTAEMVKVVEPFIDGFDGVIEASIVNYTNSTIRDIRLIAVFYPASGGRDPVYYMVIQVEDVIPPNLVTRFEKEDKVLEWHGQNTANLQGSKGVWICQFRILDYEIVEEATSPSEIPTLK